MEEERREEVGGKKRKEGEGRMERREKRGEERIGRK